MSGAGAVDDASRGQLSTTARAGLFALVAVLCALPQVLTWLGIKVAANRVDEVLADLTDLDALRAQAASLRLHELMLEVSVYTALEWTVVCLSLATAALAGARARFQPDAVAAMITAVALWASFITGWHLLAFYGLSNRVVSPPEFLFYNWAISQTFTAAIFVVASFWAIFVERKGIRTSPPLRRTLLFAMGVMLAAMAYLSVSLTAAATTLPLDLSPGRLLSRPMDLPALLLFALLLLVIFPWVDRVYRSVFSFALWLSALPFVASQLYAALASEALYDPGFLASQLTRTGGFAIIFLGLVLHYNQLCAEEIVLRCQVSDREMRTRMLIRNATEAIIVFDADTHIKQWNPRAEELFGITRDDALGRPLLECVTIDADPIDLPGFLRRLIEDPQGDASSRIYQARARGPQRTEWIPIEYTIVGAPTRPEPVFSALIRDVSEINAMQQRIAQVDRLAAVGTLAAGVAHEINNPLAYISSNIVFALEALNELPELLAMSQAERANGTGDRIAELLKELQHSLEAAQSGSERVAHIVRDMLSISHRSERTEAEAIDPLEAIEAALRLTRAQLNHRITLSTDFKPTPSVAADPARLTQIVVNLLVNAVHAVEDLSEERRAITLRLFSRKHQVILEVEDRGHGVPEELHERIFDPFFTTKAVGQGTGLGLSLSRSIAHELKGQLRLCPSERGARFQLSLPAHTGDERRDAPPATRR
ncbi:PAS domain S-box protein [Lujinxingia vulgaris]|uniref:histidine kinase n=1 Tax=Lujinxingia vulgaris TaxID=2600176 RepID=A0A5C6XEU9_9DELT|nr:ATP-binding protein [Lujinxingia vulgaris]TXD36634.1 PAS domain S-box protein [Lujinxingia vulgaris]